MSSTEPALARPGALVPNAVLGMAIFIATELMFFAGLVSAWLVLRAEAGDWPPVDQPRLPVLVTGVNTAVLIASGWTVQRAAAAFRGGVGPALVWLATTASLGAVFLAVQGTEWARLVSFGLTSTSSLYGATFYVIVVAHALHVLAALMVLLVVLARVASGRLRPEDPDALLPYRMYWLFVVGIWPALYVLVYL